MTYLRRCRILVVILGAALLPACGLLPEPRTVPDDRELAWMDLQDRLQALDGWQAAGRFNVQMADEGGSASFDWREHPDGRFSLRLSGPWGQGVARLSGDDDRVRLDTGNGHVVHGTDAALLLRDLYGWDVPVAGLRRWLIGLPTGDAGSDSYSLDRFGRLEELRWRDWEIRYRRFGQVDDLDLPVNLIARRADGEARLRIAVDHWQPGEVDPADGAGSGVPLIGD